jgi:hypothetical protein
MVKYNIRIHLLCVLDGDIIVLCCTMFLHDEIAF